jgi:rod shape determining protein RodA
MKVGLILFLARYYGKITNQQVNSIKFLLSPLIAISIPMLLVIRQPDLGTALLIGAGGLAVIYLAGLRLKYFFYSLFFLLTTAPIVISFLKPYQKLRILTFLDPERDPLGAGYQIIQSKIAVGSGGIFGKGFLKGSQSYLDYLPEKHTDFVYTLFSEEFGFVGSFGLLIVYALIIFRIVEVGNNARSSFSKLYCYSFASAFFVYVFVNMSMVLGLLPIVGAPLPIMSYGGSAMLGIMFGLGIVMSCKIHKDENII